MLPFIFGLDRNANPINSRICQTAKKPLTIGSRFEIKSSWVPIPLVWGDFRDFDLVGYATLKEALLVEGNFTDFLQKRNVKTCNKAKKLKIQRLKD